MTLNPIAQRSSVRTGHSTRAFRAGVIAPARGICRADSAGVGVNSPIVRRSHLSLTNLSPAKPRNFLEP